MALQNIRLSIEAVRETPIWERFNERIFLRGFGNFLGSCPVHRRRNASRGGREHYKGDSAVVLLMAVLFQHNFSRINKKSADHRCGLYPMMMETVFDENKRFLAQKVFGSNLILVCKKARDSCLKSWSAFVENS
jgi:hypothetical protein